MKMLARLALIPCLPLFAAATPPQPPAPPTTLPALDPAIQTALHNLSSEDFTAREHAFRNLQIAFGQQVQELLRPEDPETQARVAALLTFNEGLSHWILDTMALPDPDRRNLLAFGLRTDILPIVANAGANDPELRVQAIHDLAGNRDPLVTTILAPMIDDPDRRVYIAAMEAAWDRTPNALLVDHLWERAVEAGFAVYSPPVQQQEVIRFRGEDLGPAAYDNSAYRHMQDSDIACDVLVHLHAPQVNAKITAFFQRVDKVLNGTDAQMRENRIWMYGVNSAPMKNVYQLLEAYHPPEVLPLLYHLATGRVRQPINGQNNNLHFFWSNRTLPLATLITLTGQNPDEYKLSKLTPPFGTWTFPTEADEDAAVKKLQTWWAVRAANGAKDKVTR